MRGVDHDGSPDCASWLRIDRRPPDGRWRLVVTLVHADDELDAIQQAVDLGLEMLVADALSDGVPIDELYGASSAPRPASAGRGARRHASSGTLPLDAA